jgi:hypothetical protein
MKNRIQDSESRRQVVRLKTNRLLGKDEEAEERSQESGETMKGLGSDHRPNSTPRAFLSGHLQSKQLQPDYVSSYKNLLAGSPGNRTLFHSSLWPVGHVY